MSLSRDGGLTRFLGGLLWDMEQRFHMNIKRINTTRMSNYKWPNAIIVTFVGLLR